MNRLLALLFIWFAGIGIAVAQPYNVTFQVYMGGQTVADTVSIAGNFQVAAGFPADWTPGAVLLTDPDSNNIYTVTVSLPPGSYEFKYINGTMWGQDEGVPGACAVNGNRGVTISSDTTLAAVGFGSCGVVRNVTFQVNMREQNPISDTVSVAGNFQLAAGYSADWVAGVTILTDADVDSVYEISVAIPDGTYEYKFINGPAWGADESIPAPCNVNNNRQITIASDTTLTAFCFAQCDTCITFVPPPATDSSNVTFQVDMSQYGAAFTDVRVTGTFSGWTPAGVLMTDMGSGIWAATVNIPDTAHEYKFNVDAGTTWESFAGGESCTINTTGTYNRGITVASDTVLPAVCWESCDSCVVAPPPMIDSSMVTFQVDMSQYGAAFTDVRVTGTFTGWTPAGVLMADMGSGIWAATVNIPDTAHEYKFNVDAGTTWESFTGGESCTVNTTGTYNRGVTISSDTTLAAVCWLSCDSCIPPPAPDTVMVTFAVDMNNYSLANSFDTVYIGGSFNGFDPTVEPMADPDMDNVWEVTLALFADTAYEFKYAVDSGATWEAFTGMDACAVNTTGFWNRGLQVTSDSTLAPVCWNECDTCIPVIPPDTFLVTFQVDMNSYLDTAGFDTVYLAGDFNGFDAAVEPLSDPDMDNVWTGTIALVSGMDYEFKYTLDSGAVWEDFTGTELCVINTTGTWNRALSFGADTTLPVVCWNSCDTCLQIVPPDTINVTFQVDMSQYGAAFTNAFVSGSFNAWSGTADTLVDQGAGIYSTTLQLLADTAYEHKFTLDDWGVFEQFTGSEACVANTTGTWNRAFTASNDTTLNLVCWNSCDSCPAPQPFDTVNVTFRVNMSQYGAAFTTVYVSGDFNGWSGTADSLADPDMDGIYEGTLALDGDSVYQYKFQVDDWATSEQFNGSEACTVSAGPNVNRQLTIAANDTILPAVCWESCDTCVVTNPGDSVLVTFQVDMSDYATAFTTVSVATEIDNFDPGSNMLADPDMDDVWVGTVEVPENAVFEYKFTVDSGTDWESFNGSESCTINTTGTWNRDGAVSNTDITFPVVCWNSCSTCPPDTGSLTITVLPVDDNCADSAGAITTFVSGGVMPYSYEWSTGDTIANLSGISQGTYSVTVTDSQGSTGTQQGIVIDGASTPLALSVLVTDATGAGNDGAVDLTATGGTMPYSFSWTNTATTEDISGLTPGTYTVSVTDALGCFESIEANVAPSAIGEIASLNNLRIFPNPAKSTLSIDAQFANNQAGVVLLTDVSGRVVAIQRFVGSNVVIPLDVSALSAGVYYLRLQTGEGALVRRIAVME